MAEDNGQPQEQQEQTDRPEYISEKFWDKDRGEVNIEALGSSYKSLETKLGQRTEELTRNIREDFEKERLGKVPESYELSSPEMPENIDVNLSADVPMVQWWQDFAKSKGLSQDDFNDGIKAFVDNAVADIPNQDEQIAELGDNGKARIEAVDLWAKKNLSENAYNSVTNIATSADNVKVLEEIMGLTRDISIPSSDTAIDVNASEHDLRSMMRDARYWDDARRDPAYVNRVTALYEKKYGTNPAKLQS
tara:strand:- start:1610 stop:2356 length:747 start_codon:yes stop_codon:yes gene_type:complete